MPQSPKVRVKVQPRSGFDKSHFNLLTAEVGVITPIMIDEVFGNTKLHLRLNLAASMPPLVSDTYMKTDVCVEAFAIPHRLCYGGFEQWYTQRLDNVLMANGATATRAYFPKIVIPSNLLNIYKPFFEARSLADYLGFLSSDDLSLSASFAFNPLPFVAYHLCYEHYYRNPMIQRSAFARPSSSIVTSGTEILTSNSVACLPYITFDAYSGTNEITAGSGFLSLADNHKLLDLRKRNFGYDYFTNAYPTVSLRGDMSIQVDENTNKFTINQLRAINSLQMFQEKNQLAGQRYTDTVLARTGASPSDGVASRPILLGSARYNCYNKSVSVYGSPMGFASDYNPFVETVQSVQGNMYASGSDLIIDGFEAKEPMYILVVATLVPTVTYSSGVNRILTRYRDMEGSIADMANPLLQNTGNEPIKLYELQGGIGLVDSDSTNFGYTDRFASWKIMRDEIHGLFRKNHQLQAFVSQRYFEYDDIQGITSAFLQIPSTYLDNVLVVGSDMSDYGYWLECGFDYKVSQPLAEYSIPSLQDPAYEHGDTITLHRGGFRF